MATVIFALCASDIATLLQLWVGAPTPKLTLIQGVLINGICLFKDGTRAATAARKANAELDEKYK